MEGLVRGGEDARQEGGEVGGVADRVLHAVKGHGPHSVREQVGVGLSEEATCRLAVEGQTRVTDEAAEVVEVPGRVGGGDVGEQVTVARAAPLRQRDGLRQVALLVLAGGRHGHALPEGLSLGAAGEAAHRRAAAGAARVPADYVEPAAGDGVQRPALLGNGGHAGVSGPAGIDEQRADPLTGMAGEVTDHRQRDGSSAVLRPVQRNGHPRALQLRTAAGPADRRGRRGALGCISGRGDRREGRDRCPRGQNRNGQSAPTVEPPRSRRGSPVWCGAFHGARSFRRRRPGKSKCPSCGVLGAPDTYCRQPTRPMCRGDVSGVEIRWR